jgi:hypothetical protein
VSDPLDLTAFEQRNTERRRLKADATEGPWKPMCGVFRYVEASPGGGYRNAGVSDMFAHGPRHEAYDHNGNRIPREQLEPLAQADAAFIAAARNDPVESDVDALLAEVRRLMGLIAEADRRTGELWDDTGEDQVYE